MLPVQAPGLPAPVSVPLSGQVFTTDIPTDNAAPDLASIPGVAAPRGDLRQLVAVGSMRFVVGFDESREYIDTVTSLTRIPRSPSWLLGVFASDGAAVPLVDLEAWAHGRHPVPWRKTDAPARSGGSLAGTAGAHGTGGLKALRMADDANAWALRVNQAPSVLAFAHLQSQIISHRLPLTVSANHGHLMPMATAAWFLPDDLIALQMRWASLASALRKALSGISV